jgi:hypothetical protein
MGVTGHSAAARPASSSALPFARAGALRLMLALGAALLAAPGCAAALPRAAVSLHVARTPDTPADASVIIDEMYVGPLGYVAARGVRLPTGEHRITVYKAGYFPFDALVVADRKPLNLQVRLIPVPD